MSFRAEVSDWLFDQWDRQLIAQEKSNGEKHLTPNQMASWVADKIAEKDDDSALVAYDIALFVLSLNKEYSKADFDLYRSTFKRSFNE